MGVDILQFLDARFQACPDFKAAFPGNLEVGRADGNTPRPYVLMNVLAEPPAFNTEGPYSELAMVQFSIVASSVPEVRDLRTLLCRHPTAGLDRISRAPLGDGDSLVTSVRTGGAPTLDESPGPDAGEIWMGTIDYLFFIYRDN